MVDVVGHHRTDHTDVINAPGNVRQQFADLDTALSVLPELESRREKIVRPCANQLGHLER